MKQYEIKVSSKESEDFEMQIIAHENIRFSDLHQAIQTALEYDPLQMASFFMSNEIGEKEEEIALIDMEDSGEATLMEDVKISERFVKEGQKARYLYDFFSERVLLMNIDEITVREEKIFSIDVEGEIPMQINIDNDGIDDLMKDMGGFVKGSSLDEFDDDFGDELGNEEISFESLDNLEGY